jgi:rod shape-determining protein MreC
MERYKRLSIVGLLVSAVLSPFIFFSSPLKPWESNNPAVAVIQNALYPVERAWNAVTTAVTRTLRNYVTLSDAAGENLKLRSQLASMQTRIMDYEEQVLENDRLRRLLGFSGRSEQRLIAAEVIGHNDEAPFQSIRITRGSADGVRPGMPVVAADGVVGKVIRTGLHFADVQLLVDSDFHLDVLLQRTRVRGVLSGSERTHCTLQLAKRVEIRIGDTLITSGIVGGFPKGLPVGRVMRITYESDNVAQTISVEPWVDHRRVEEVMVIFSPDKELEKIVETAGPEWIEKTVGAPEGVSARGG